MLTSRLKMSSTRPRRGDATGGQQLALVREPDDPANEWQRCDQAHPMLSCEQFELGSQRGEAAGLDLDQQVAADEIDNETVDDPFDAIAGALVPVLELSVQCTLVQRPNRRELSFPTGGYLENAAHADAPSAPRRSCLQQVAGSNAATPGSRCRLPAKTRQLPRRVVSGS
jgi:hypothetical protein